jgi:hypothetical protein
VDLSLKSCLCGVILIVIAGSLACGCICGFSQPGQPVIGDNKTGDLVMPVENPGTGTLRPEVTGIAISTPGPTPCRRPAEFTVHADGGKDHEQGETIRIYGVDTYSDTVYLFVSCMMAPVNGGRTDNVKLPVVDGDVKTFTRINVSEDGAWEYDWTPPRDQPMLMFDLYNVIAAAEPRDKPHLDDAPAWDMVTVKISANSQSRL